MLDIFSPMKKVKRRGKARDKFDELIDVIERFAPREHLSNREAFYYNYRMMEQYKQPLFNLLETVSQISPRRSEQDSHLYQLFQKLKDFYDVHQKLSMAEAMEDNSLIRRFRDFFIFFYDRKDLTGDDIKDLLKKQ